MIKELCKEAQLQLDKNLNKAIKLADEAYLKSIDINDEESNAKCLLLFGMIRYKKGEFSSANEYYESCLTLCNKNNFIELKTNVLKQLGDLRLEVNDYDSALEYYLSCLEMSGLNFHSDQEKSNILFSLGIIYKELEQYNIAIEYFEEAIGLCSDKDIYKSLSKLYSHLAESYMDIGQLKEAERYIQKAINSALEQNDDFEFGYAYMIYAKYFYEVSNYKESKVFFEKSMKKFAGIHQNIHLLIAMTEYGIMLYNSENYDGAENILSEASILLRNEKNLNVELKVYLYLAKIYERTKNHSKALTYFIRFNEVKTVNDETWKNIKVKNIINKYEYLRSDLKVKELISANENLVILSKLGREITSTLNRFEITEKISKSIFQLFPCDSFGVGFIQDEKALEYTIFEEGQRKEIRIDLKNGSNYLTDLLNQGEEVIDNDYQINLSKKQHVNFMVKGSEKIKSLMACPLRFENEILGIITVNSYVIDAYKDNNLEILKILSAYISIALNNCMQSQALIDSNKKLKELTEKDGLTKVYNRYSLNTNTAKIIQRAQKYEKPYSIMMLDVDSFKEYNDNYGHLAGDQCLVNVSAVLNEVCSKEKSYIYRYGGDEFLIILLNKDAKEAGQVAQEILLGVSNLQIEHLFSRCSEHVTLTIGVATIIGNITDYNKIFALADKALYIAKNRGRNNVKQLMYE